MRVFAFDVGQKKTGIALGNTVTGGAEPLAVARGNRPQQLAAITRHIANWQPHRLVVGLPLHMDGGEHEITAMCRSFGHLLRDNFQIPTEFFDERLTTELAKKFRDSPIDAAAAAIILQDWMDKNANRIG